MGLLAEPGAENKYEIGRKVGEDEDMVPEFDVTGTDAMKAFESSEPGLYLLCNAADLKDVIARCRISASGQRSYYKQETRSDWEQRMGGKAIGSMTESWERQTLIQFKALDRLESRCDTLEKENTKLRDENWELRKKLDKAEEENSDDMLEAALGAFFEGFQKKNIRDDMQARLDAIRPMLTQKEQDAVFKAVTLALQIGDQVETEEEKESD